MYFFKCGWSRSNVQILVFWQKDTKFLGIETISAYIDDQSRYEVPQFRVYLPTVCCKVPKSVSKMSQNQPFGCFGTFPSSLQAARYIVPGTRVGSTVHQQLFNRRGGAEKAHLPYCVTCRGYVTYPDVPHTPHRTIQEKISSYCTNNPPPQKT